MARLHSRHGEKPPRRGRRPGAWHQEGTLQDAWPILPAEATAMSDADWPGLIDVTQLHSRDYRDDRSRGLARYYDVPEDGVEAFVERMEVSWQRQLEYEAVVERRRRDELHRVASRGRLGGPRLIDRL